MGHRCAVGHGSRPGLFTGENSMAVTEDVLLMGWVKMPLVRTSESELASPCMAHAVAQPCPLLPPGALEM